MMRSGRRNREVVIQQRETTQDPTYGTTIEGDWTDVATVWANVRDMLPSRGEQLADGVNISRRPARIRMLFRDGLSSSMRLVIVGRAPDEPDRIMRVLAGPAEIEVSGFRREIEWMAEELSSEGQEP